MLARKIIVDCTKCTSPILWSASRAMSTAGFIKAHEVNKNLRIAHHTLPHDQPRPLVLLFGWLMAKPIHMKKYSDFYHHQGFDVISVKIFLNQLLRPKKVQEIMRHVLDLCHEGDRKHQPIICHGLSVGGYLYGEVLNSILDHDHKYGRFGDRVYGQILDSPVDFYGIPRGVARAVTNDSKKWNKIETSLEWYLGKFENITQDYIRSSQTFQSNVLQTPSLFIYSHSDPVCNPAHIEQLAETWRTRGIESETVFWDRAPHVTSFKKYPDEYEYYVKDFLLRTGIPGHRIVHGDITFTNQESADENAIQERVQNMVAFA